MFSFKRTISVFHYQFTHSVPIQMFAPIAMPLAPSSVCLSLYFPHNNHSRPCEPHSKTLSLQIFFKFLQASEVSACIIEKNKLTTHYGIEFLRHLKMMQIKLVLKPPMMTSLKMLNRISMLTAIIYYSYLIEKICRQKLNLYILYFVASSRPNFDYEEDTVFCTRLLVQAKHFFPWSFLSIARPRDCSLEAIDRRFNVYRNQSKWIVTDNLFTLRHW